MLSYHPPGVQVNPDLYNPRKRPPIYERWDKWRKRPSRFRQQ